MRPFPLNVPLYSGQGGQSLRMAGWANWKPGWANEKIFRCIAPNFAHPDLKPCRPLDTDPHLLAEIKERSPALIQTHNAEKWRLSGKKTDNTWHDPGQRRRGRPRICYEDNIRNWTGLKEDQLLRSAEDRKLWRRFVHKAANPRREDGWRQDKTCHSCHCTQQNRELLLTYYVHCIHRSELVRPSVLPRHCRLLWLVETSCRYRQQAMHTQHTQCTTLGPLSPDINHPAVSDVVWDRQSQDKTGLRPKKNSLGLGIGLARCGLGLASLVLCCETWSCHARRHNDLEGQSNFSSTVYSFSILCLEHYYCGDQQWRSLTWKLNPSGTSSAAAFISSCSYTAPGDHYQQTPGEPWLLHSSPV